MYYLTILYLVCFILGFNFGLWSNPYDEYRIIEIFLAIFSFIIIIFSKINLNKITILIFSIIFCLIVFNLKNYNIFNIQDLLLWLSSFFIFLSLYIRDSNSRIDNFFLVILVIFSIIPCIFIFISIFDLLMNNVWFDWQFNFGSIRIFDSYIVVIFWLSIFLMSKKNVVIKKIFWFICFFVGLALFFSAARSALMSIFLPLLLLFGISNENRKLIIKSLFVFFLAFTVYFIVFYLKSYFHNVDDNLNIARFSTSNRYEIWQFMYKNWLQYPFNGLGGGYLAKEQYLYGHHTHNVFFRLFFEWGVVGYTLLGFLIYHFYLLFCSKLDNIIKMGILAILIDAMFSGNFIYPAPQVLCIFFLAFSFSRIKNPVEQNIIFSKILIICYAGLFLYLLYNHLWVDISCLGCSSEFGRAAPFFWEHGASEHLQ